MTRGISDQLGPHGLEIFEVFAVRKDVPLTIKDVVRFVQSNLANQVRESGYREPPHLKIAEGGSSNDEWNYYIRRRLRAWEALQIVIHISDGKYLLNEGSRTVAALARACRMCVRELLESDMIAEGFSEEELV